MKVNKLYSKIISSSKKLLNNVLNYSITLFESKAVPLFSSYFIPFWNKNLKPTWDSKLYPLIKESLYPKWKKHIVPHMLKLDIQLYKFIDYGIGSFNSWNNNKRTIFLTLSNLILIAFAAIFYILPQYNEYNKNHQRISGIKRSLRSLVLEEKAFLSDISDNPNKSLQDNITVLNEKITKQNEEIEKFTQNQLETPRMVQVIKSKVAQNEALKLLRVASLSTYRVTPISMGATKIGLDKLPAIFVHPIELDIDGDYINTYKFLTSLESSWRIFWDSMEYLVDNYPTAKVSIRVHLLALAKALDE